MDEKPSSSSSHGGDAPPARGFAAPTAPLPQQQYPTVAGYPSTDAYPLQYPTQHYPQIPYGQPTVGGALMGQQVMGGGGASILTHTRAPPDGHKPPVIKILSTRHCFSRASSHRHCHELEKCIEPPRHACKKPPLLFFLFSSFFFCVGHTNLLQYRKWLL